MIRCLTTTIIESEVRKLGNSFAVIIPKNIIEKDAIKERQKIRLILIRESRKVLNETFGMSRGRLKKSGQQIKDELRRELYN